MSPPSPPTAEESGTTGSWKFFRASPEGRPVFEKEFDKLPQQARAALVVLMSQYVAGELPLGGIKPVREDILELRWRQGNNHFRILFFRWGTYPVALTAFYKNQQKTPKTRIKTALERQKTWQRTFGENPPAT